MTLSHVIPDSVRVFSFDVFDTVLTRSTATPSGVFQMMAQRMCLHPSLGHLTERFVTSRMLAESQCRRLVASEEVTLEQIYHTLSSNVGLSQDQRELLCSWELETEHSVFRPVKPVLMMIEQLRVKGGRIIFISDMYLPKEFVKGLLFSVGAFQEGDGIYVSSSVGVTKRSGNLFVHVLAEEGLLPSQLFHIGDNPIGDVAVPRNLGIAGIPFHEAVLCRSEEMLLKVGSSGCLVAQKMAGASRCARVATSRDCSGSSAALYHTGATFAGPVFTAFVSWLLCQARNDRVQRLYFVARDGQILKAIAEEMERSSADSPELRYLYGSRQAWHLPAVLHCDAATADWLLLADPYVSLSVISRRAEVAVAELQKALHAYGCPVDDPLRQLSAAELSNIRQMVCRESPLQTLLLDAAESARQRALAYFETEGLLDEVSWGIVDLGWHGNLQDSLQRILACAGHVKPLIGYYFGLLRDDESGNRKNAFFFTPASRDAYFAWGTACMTILELLASGDHGVTRGYDMVPGGGAVARVEHRNERALLWGLADLREGILAYVREYCDASSGSSFRTQDRTMLLPLIKWFCTDPPKEIASALGCFPFSSDQAETEFHPFAPPISLLQALNYLINYAHPRRFLTTYWIHGSRVQSGRATRWLLSLSSHLFWLVNGIKRRAAGSGS